MAAPIVEEEKVSSMSPVSSSIPVRFSEENWLESRPTDHESSSNNHWKGVVENDDVDDDDDEFRRLQNDYERSMEERKRDQNEAELEKQRLEEILRLCYEYDAHQSIWKGDRDPETRLRLGSEKRDSRTSWGSGSRIKTNGSLTSLVTQNRRSDDVGQYVMENGAAIFDSDYRTLSPKIDKNLDKMAISKAPSSKLIEQSDFTVNIPLNESNRNNRFQENTTVFSSNEDFFRQELNSVIANHLTDAPLTSTDSTVTNGSPIKRPGEGVCGNQGYPTGTIPHARNGSHLPRKFSNLGMAKPSKESRQKKSVEDAKQRIEVLQQRVHDIKNIEEKTINETQSELELLQWEYNALIEQLRREKDRIAAINDFQMELLLEAAKEREEAKKHLDSERCRLEQLEKQLEEARKRCLALGTYPAIEVTRKGSVVPDDLVAKEMEEVDQQRRYFEDLEFHLLELETRREEEREPRQRQLTAELGQVMHSCGLVEETLRQLSEQKTSLVLQLKSDIVDLERERILLIEDFRKEKRKLLCLPKESPPQLYTRPVYSPVSTKEVTNGESFGFDEDVFPTTPSSTTSVVQRLQELQKQTAADKAVVSSSRTGSFDLEAGDQDDSLRSPDSSTSFDRPRSWYSAGVVAPLTQRQDNNSCNNGNRPRFLSGSDDDGSIFSADERFDEHSFVTNGSQMFPSSFEQNNSVSKIDIQNSSIDSYCIRNAQSVNEVSTTAYEWATKDNGSQNVEGQKLANVVTRQGHKVQARPMTRYLPVRGTCDLDLRQFIESSGHRLGESIEVQVTGSTCRGFLVKLGRRLRLWSRRWFVFDRCRRSISYYSDEKEKRARGCILFGSIEDVFVDHLRKVRSPSPKLTFCLKTSARSIYLLAPSPEAMRIWIDVLFSGAEGYQGFS